MQHTKPIFLILTVSGLIACSDIQTFEYIDNREIPPGPGLFTEGGTLTLDLLRTDQDASKESKQNR